MSARRLERRGQAPGREHSEEGRAVEQGQSGSFCLIARELEQLARAGEAGVLALVVTYLLGRSLIDRRT